MPELPDIEVYVEALRARVMGEELVRIRVASPHLLHTAAPPLEAVSARKVENVRRFGKRIVFGLDEDFWLALHLMIAGRLHWRELGAKLMARRGVAAFDFPSGSLLLTEAGSKKRTALHVFKGGKGLAQLNAGGLEVFECEFDAYSAALTSANHTLKRALTDPRTFSGIGNAYSDEILHRARLSPLTLTQRMSREEITRLFEACRTTLSEWTAKLRAEANGDFPEHVTAFRPGMAVHGKYGQPCPRCGAKVQRIRYTENETNYCPPCQTGGKLLADRSLSRLLKKDWPRTLEELESLKEK